MKTLSMLTLRNIGAAVLVMVFASVLSGCSREPSAADIDKLMRAEAAASKNIELHEVRKIGCAAAQGASGYMCDVELDSTVTQHTIFGSAIQLPRNKSTVKIRVFDDQGKWKVSAT